MTGPCVPLFAFFYFFGLAALAAKGCRLPGVTWDHFRCTVEPSRSHTRCRKTLLRIQLHSQISANPKCWCLNVRAWNPQESGRKTPLSCNAACSMLHCNFWLAAVQLLVKMTSALQKSQCCSATSAAHHSENCSATSVFACGMLQGRGLEGWGLGLAEN